MIRLLPFVLIPILIIGGLLFWRNLATKQSLTTSQANQSDLTPVEVPKTLPGASLEDRVKSLEDTITKLVPQVNNLKPGSSPAASSSLDSRLKDVESTMTELKARVSSLEKATPAPAATSSKATIYIPLGSGGSVSSVDWASLNAFQINLDPAQYPGYSSMQLEVNMRLNQPGGTLYARLYNSTSGAATSSEVSSTSTTSSIFTSSTFNLSTGSKTYILQAKTSDGTLGFLDTARIKVNF